jgi:hypothetical protein
VLKVISGNGVSERRSVVRSQATSPLHDLSPISCPVLWAHLKVSVNKEFLLWIGDVPKTETFSIAKI